MFAAPFLPPGGDFLRRRLFDGHACLGSAGSEEELGDGSLLDGGCESDGSGGFEGQLPWEEEEEEGEEAGQPHSPHQQQGEWSGAGMAQGGRVENTGGNAKRFPPDGPAGPEPTPPAQVRRLNGAAAALRVEDRQLRWLTVARFVPCSSGLRGSHCVS